MVLICSLKGDIVNKMVVSKENQAFFSKLIEPLATSHALNRMFVELKSDVLSTLEERILNQDKRIDQLEAELQICKNVSK